MVREATASNEQTNPCFVAQGAVKAAQMSKPPEQHHDVFGELGDESFRETELPQSIFTEAEWQELERVAEGGIVVGEALAFTQGVIRHAFNHSELRRRAASLVTLHREFGV